MYKFVCKKNKIQVCLMVLFVLLALFHDRIISRVPEIVGKLWSVTVFPYMWMFLLGVFLCENKERSLGFLKKTWIPLLITAYIFIKFASDITLVRYGFVSSTLSFVAFLGFAYQFPKFNLKTDISYAVYVYHMVIVNAFIALDLTQNIIYMVASFVITFAISYLSTKTIGAFGLNKKKKFG